MWHIASTRSEGPCGFFLSIILAKTNESQEFKGGNLGNFSGRALHANLDMSV